MHPVLTFPCMPFTGPSNYSRVCCLLAACYTASRMCVLHSADQRRSCNSCPFLSFHAFFVCSTRSVPVACHIRPTSVGAFKFMMIKRAHVQAMSYKAETVRLRQYVVKLEEQGRLLAKEAMHWRTKWTQSNYQNMQMYSELSASSRVNPNPSTNHAFLLLSDGNNLAVRCMPAMLIISFQDHHLQWRSCVVTGLTSNLQSP